MPTMLLSSTFRTFGIKRIANSVQSLRLLSASAEYAEQDESVSPENQSRQKLLKLAVIGLPNAGKSTLINNLMDRKVIFVFCAC